MLKTLKLRQFGLAVAILASIGQAAVSETITAYTAVLPPYTLGPDLDAPGISHELVNEINERTGLDIAIEYLPWARAQMMVQQTPNTLLFTATRSASREDLYSWVTLMAEPSEVFVTLEAPIDRLEDASSVNVVVLDNTPRHGRLTEAGIANIALAREAAMAARMLDGGRVTSWYTLDHRAAYVFRSEGLDPSQLVFGAPQRSPKNWMAAHPDFDPAVAAQIDAAMTAIREDGTYDAIMAKYLN